MITRATDGVVSHSFDIFSRFPVEAVTITRKGGTSPAPWKSMNLGGTVGDDPGNVKANKQLIFEAFNLNPDRIFDVWQVHSADWVYTRKARLESEPHKKADIIITNELDLTLMMRFADCVPLFVYDPDKQAIGIAHAGWQGTVKNVAGVLVKAMQQTFGSEPVNLLAAIGPAICMKHYPVGSEVIEAVTQSLGQEIYEVSDHFEGNYKLDLKKSNEIQFHNAGINRVENSGLCTVCDNEDWFSHRKENGKTGRFGAFIRLVKSS